jgi:hypothetical protein
LARDEGDTRDLAGLEADPPVVFAGFGHLHPVYRVVVWCFVVASVSHLLLADAWQWEWLFADIVYLAGIGLLAWRGAFAGWVLSALGLLLPLLFHRDQLTQSVFLLFVATGGALSTGRAAWRIVVGDETSSGGEGEPNPDVWAFLRAVQWLTILAYALAFFHKLNADFLNPQTSCAVYGLREVTDYWHLPAVEMPASAALIFPIGILLAEAGIAALHLLRYRRVAWLVAISFHIFLTFTMAPAFVFVMAVGHAAFVTREDLERLNEALDAHGVVLALIGAGMTAGSIAAHGEWPDLTMIPREFLLWGTLGLLVAAFPPWRGEVWCRTDVRRPRTMFAAVLPGVFACLFFANGLTPYLGVQFQHTAAMVSNLRIDRGCWNHLVVPESVRVRDEYIRIDEVYFGEPGAIPDYEKLVREQLWSPPRIRQIRRNWCRPEVRPLYLEGRHIGERFVIEDLCAGEPLPFNEWRMFGVAVFGDYLRFQKSLERDCPQQCIH